MKLRISVWFLMALLLTGCYTDDFFEINKGAFYKLYGNGTTQEAVAMHLTEEGDIYLVGNQYVRNNPDSAAVLIMSTDAGGNQRWSVKDFGKGFCEAKAMLVLPSGQILLLAASRPHNQGRLEPVLYRLDAAGNLLKTFYLEPGENSKTNPFNSVPEDMVLNDKGAVYVVGNRWTEAGESRVAYIKKIDLETGDALDDREFSTADRTEAKRILRKDRQLLVIGNSWQETGESKKQNVFTASFSANLVEAGLVILGGPLEENFHKAILSSLKEFVLLSSEQVIESGKMVESKGVLSFVEASTLDIRQNVYLAYNSREIPEAIEEDEEGNFYVALTILGERDNSGILINKVDPLGNTLWDMPKEIGGAGADRIVQISLKDGYVYLLKTIDMKNESKLISLSKIRM